MDFSLLHVALLLPEPNFFCWLMFLHPLGSYSFRWKFCPWLSRLHPPYIVWPSHSLYSCSESKLGCQLVFNAPPQVVRCHLVIGGATSLLLVSLLSSWAFSYLLGILKYERGLIYMYWLKIKCFGVYENSPILTAPCIWMHTISRGSREITGPRFAVLLWTQLNILMVLVTVNILVI